MPAEFTSVRGRSGGQVTPLQRAATVAVCFYSFTLFIFVSSGFLRGGYDPADIYRVGIPMMLVDGLLAFQLYWLLGPTARLNRIARWAILAAGALLVAALQSAWDTQLRIWSGSVWKDYGTPYAAFIRAGNLNFWHTGLFVVLLAFQRSNDALREQQKQLIASRASERDAHMMALRFQLNPHFLFNTLNAISSLVVVGRSEHAEAMIDRLAVFLRATLTADPRSLVRIDEEFDMLDTYLEIESVRFGKRLVTSIDLPTNLASLHIPPFLLQPIVENAIKYAVAPSSRPVEVSIAAREEDGALLLIVSDDGDGKGDVASGTGVGLANVRERLRLKYGAAAILDKQQGPGGCRVQIEVPLHLVAGAAAQDQFPVFA